jgi:hypothetical protein
MGGGIIDKLITLRSREEAASRFLTNINMTIFSMDFPSTAPQKINSFIKHLLLSHIAIDQSF